MMIHLPKFVQRSQKVVTDYHGGYIMRILKELYGLIYGELPQASLAQEALHQEIEHIKDPLRGRQDFEELQEICLEVNCCSQEYG